MHCYFTGELGAIHLSGTVIISGGHLQWSQGYCISLKQEPVVIPFFKDIELIRNSSCSHPFNEWPFFYYKKAIARILSDLLRFYKAGILAMSYHSYQL